MPVASANQQHIFLNDEDNIAPLAVSVLIPLPLDGCYDYLVPEDLALAPGDLVRVPLGPRSVVGVVWDRDEDAEPPDTVKLKAVVERLDVPSLPEVSRRFVEWVSNYNMTPLGMVLRMVLGPPKLLKPGKPRTAYQLGGVQPERMTSARERVLGVLRDGPPRTAIDLMETAGVSRAVITGLAELGAVSQVLLPPQGLAAGDTEKPDANKKGPDLSDDQHRAAESLVAAVEADTFSTTVLEGVTGAGKTEVYFEAIAAALQSDDSAQVVVLMPEIALTEQFLNRFHARFGAFPTGWHSDLGTRERREAWQSIISGEARVVVGARSALFLPYPNLKLIVVDEEHDPAYKQEDRVIYHARDMAIVRALLGEFAAILVSATPSLETMVNCWEGRYGHVTLPVRHGGAVVPKIEAIDMRRAPPDRGSWLSPVLIEALEETLAAGEQSLLFLNRRGYAPAAICRACGHRMQREDCSAPLVVHGYGRQLKCHYCSYSVPMPEACPNCGAEESIIAYGPGVERLAEEVAKLFPEARIGVMSSDTIMSPAEGRRFIDQVAAHKIDIIIGTQLVTKGHHFPMLTLVGIIDADLGLSGGDLRAAERTYQQLWQVAGRAGRAARPGRVFLQSYMPEHPVMQALASGDGPGFYKNEAAAREQQGMPPFGRLAALILSGSDERAVAAAANRLAATAPRLDGFQVLGPAPAPFARLRGLYRYRLLVKAGKTINVQKLLADWLIHARPKGGVRVSVDIDPYSFL